MNKPYCDEKGNIIDFYELLNIPFKARKEMIRSAFCNLIKMYHPDVSGRDTDEDRKKVDLIIKGYKILIDDDARKDYTNKLLSSQKFNDEGYIYLPKNRVKYSVSLTDLLSNRMLNKKITRTERMRLFGKDIEIFITPRESEKGAVALVDLPSRKTCYVCYGEDKFCHVCGGVGRITAVAHLEVKINPNSMNGNILNIDLSKNSPDKFTSFTMKSLRIKVTVITKIK